MKNRPFYFLLLMILTACVHEPGEEIENNEQNEIDYGKTDSVKTTGTISIQQNQ